MSAIPHFHTKFSVRELDSQHVDFINLGKINETEMKHQFGMRL
jgi:hypothetical protein